VVVVVVALLIDPCVALRAGAARPHLHRDVSSEQHRSRPLVASGVDTGILATVDLVSNANILGVVDKWFTTQPYESAFAVTAFKATCSDLLAQTRERMAAVDAAVAPNPTSDDPESGSSPRIIWPRTLAFLLYGGLYQGCAQYFLFNECFPAWFGVSDDLATVATKVLFDQFVVTPLLCLPVVYLLKAAVFMYPLSEGLRRYAVDAQKDLLIKYWALWTPVQCLTFGVVPPQWRIPFIAFVSFFWLIVLSSISARDDAVQVKGAR
tara:strand:- start:5648 stop:6442 length:795 start_codon:yes stop_codon:yes gene_type:complete